MTRPRDFRLALGAALVVVSLAGCRALEPLRPKADDVTVDRQQRRAEMREQFQEQRDFADLRMAREQCQRGDLPGCDATLARILGRTPDHIEAKLLLAELRLEQGRGGEVLADLKSLAENRPDDAHVQYLTATVLDACGDTQAAIPYYAQAARLAPANELYAQSHLTAGQPVVRLASAGNETSGRAAGSPERPFPCFGGTRRVESR